MKGIIYLQSEDVWEGLLLPTDYKRSKNIVVSHHLNNIVLPEVAEECFTHLQFSSYKTTLVPSTHGKNSLSYYPPVEMSYELFIWSLQGSFNLFIVEFR